MAELGKCRSCHTPVRWAITAARGRPIPLDPDPTPDGTYVLDEIEGANVARVLGRYELRPALLYVAHFATCTARGKSGKEVERRALQRTLLKAREDL